MAISCRSVRTYQLPSKVSSSHTISFLNTLRRDAEVGRPCIVLDCSNLKSIDSHGMDLVLACLEEAMKCNGDVRLAGVEPQVFHKLRSAGMLSLFEIFATPERAAQSFQKSAKSAATLTFFEKFIEADTMSAA